MSEVRFTQVALGDVPWAELDALPDRTVFQGRPWLDFLAATQRAEPVVALAHHGRTPVGWFTGARVRRYGLSVLGSPLPGWTTSYQGFNLAPGADGVDRLDRLDLLRGLVPFAAELGCRHVEVMDRRLAVEEVVGAGWSSGSLPGWELDLRPSADELLAATTSSCRWGIRKAERNGLVVEEVEGGDPAATARFAATFHDLLTEVFERRGARVTYPRSRVKALIDYLTPAGQLLLLTVREGGDGGPVVAAGIFPGSHGTAYYWGGASRTAAQRLLPNEALLWGAITRWKERGATAFDFGGGGPFKEKFGGAPIEVAWARRSSPAALERLRNLAAAAQRRRSRSS